MNYLLVNCTFVALEMRLLGCFIVAEVTLEPHIFLGSIQPLHPNYYCGLRHFINQNLANIFNHKIVLK